MPTLVVTGANRGIGLALTEHYLNEGWELIATCRQPDTATALAALHDSARERCTVLPLDVTEPTSVSRLAARLAGRPLDLLINNAGVSGNNAGALGRYRYQAWQETFATNCLGAVRVSEALLDNLRRGAGKTLVAITSQLGSIANSGGGFEAYAVSKAALNMAMRDLAANLRGDGIKVLMLHPGWVKTDMGGASAPVSAAQSAAGIARVVATSSLSDSGRFLDYRGNELPW